MYIGTRLDSGLESVENASANKVLAIADNLIGGQDQTKLIQGCQPYSHHLPLHRSSDSALYLESHK